MKRTIRLPRSNEGGMLLDIVSYGRGGPRSFTPTQREQIARTAGRTPEVVVKVTGGARTLAGVERYMDYTGRQGKLGMETDEGNQMDGKGFERSLIEDWNLDLEAHQRQSNRSIRGRIPTRLVRNIVFSMPPGTPSKKVLQAVRKLAADQFALKHRYALALHTDEPHPHVHVVVKSMSEEGKRLHVDRATLREWRQQFARNLRELGVAANATERAVRGQSKARKRDSIFRAEQRGASTHMDGRRHRVATAMAQGTFRAESGRANLVATRKSVVDGWLAVGDRLQSEGQAVLAAEVRRFVDRMPPVLTEDEILAGTLRHRQHAPKAGLPPRTR